MLELGSLLDMILSHHSLNRLSLNHQWPVLAYSPHRILSRSPSIYELVITPPTLRKCCECGNNLGDKYKTPHCNIINKTCRQKGYRKIFYNRSANTQSGLFRHI